MFLQKEDPSMFLLSGQAIQHNHLLFLIFRRIRGER
jgi:hypothetical protein